MQRLKVVLVCLVSLLFIMSGNVQAKKKCVVWPEYIIHLHASGHAYLVDPKTDRVVADLITGKGGTLGSTTPDGRKVYVCASAPGEREVTVIDLEKRKVVARVETGNRPKHPLVSPDGRLVGVNHWGLDNGKLRVTFIDTKTDRVIKHVDLPVSNTNPSKVTSMHSAWSPDSRYFFTVDRVDNQVVVIDTKNWGFEEYNVPSAPHYVVPTEDGKEIWLVVEGVDRDNPPGVIVYSFENGRLKEIAFLKMPLIGEQVVEGHHGNFTQDGRYFYLLNRGGGKNKVGREIAIFDAETKKLIKRITTASYGIGHAYNSPDGRYEVITNYGNNVITIIDNYTLTPVKDLVIGTGRMGHVAFTPDGRWAYISNAKDGNLFKLDMWNFEVVKEIRTGGEPGAGQVLNVWNNYFEFIPKNICQH